MIWGIKKVEILTKMLLFRLIFCLFRLFPNTETPCFDIKAKQPKQTSCFGQCRNQFRFQFRLFLYETSFGGHPSSHLCFLNVFSIVVFAPCRSSVIDLGSQNNDSPQVARKVVTGLPKYGIRENMSRENSQKDIINNINKKIINQEKREQKRVDQQEKSSKNDAQEKSANPKMADVRDVQ